MRTLCFVSILLSLYSCANIGTLGGGKEDDKAPEIVRSNLTETNFNSSKIILEFNEYITLNNPERNITLQPQHTTLKFSVIKKKLVISLDTSLEPNTTYNFIIDNGVMDNNANNPFSYSATFSTGNTIDTGTLGVYLNEYKGLKNLKIALSLNNGSDSFVHFSPSYILDANKDFIVFKGLNNAPYNVWLFTDNNNDLKPDLYQPINFIETPEKDSVYKLEPHVWQAPFKLNDAITDKTFLKLKYSPTLQYKSELEKLFGSIPVNYLYTTKDSALILLQPDKDILSKIAIPTDTVQSINSHKEILSLVQESIRIIKIKNEYQISIFKPSYYHQKNGEQEHIIIKAKKPDSLVWLPNPVFSEKADTIRLEKKEWQDYKTLAILVLNIKSNSNKFYDLVLLKDNKEVLKVNEINQYENYLEPGTYKIRIYESSKLHVFNPFRLSPAPQKLYEKEITLKANWDEVLTINLE